MSRVFDIAKCRIPIPDTPMREINGPDLILIQWLWLHHDFGVSIAVSSWHIKVPIADVSADVTRGLTRVRSCHVSLWFVNCMSLKCYICLTPVILWLCHVSLGDLVYRRELDQRSRSYVDLTIQIQSGFRISRNRGFSCRVKFALWNPDPRNSDATCPLRYHHTWFDMY